MRPTWARLRHMLPVGVTLKRSEGLSRRVTGCFAAAQHDTMRQLRLMPIKADKSAPTSGALAYLDNGTSPGTAPKDGR
jgi:hypothetical protein